MQAACSTPAYMATEPPQKEGGAHRPVQLKRMTEIDMSEVSLTEATNDQGAMAPLTLIGGKTDFNNKKNNQFVVHQDHYIL